MTSNEIQQIIDALEKCKENIIRSFDALNEQIKNNDK